MLDFELLWKVITLLTYMTHIGTFVLDLVTGNAVVLKKLELWKVYRLTVARHFQSEKLNWDSGRGELNIDCTYKGSVTRFSIWFSLSKQNHFVWTQNLISKYESKCRFKIDWSPISIQQSGAYTFIKNLILLFTFSMKLLLMGNQIT